MCDDEHKDNHKKDSDVDIHTVKVDFLCELVIKLVIITNFLFNSRNCSFSRFKNIRKKHVLEGVQEWKILYSIVLMFDYPYMNRPPSVQPPWRRSATPSSSTERLPRYS